MLNVSGWLFVSPYPLWYILYDAVYPIGCGGGDGPFDLDGQGVGDMHLNCDDFVCDDFDPL